MRIHPPLIRQIVFFAGILSYQPTFNENEDFGNGAGTIPTFLGSFILKNMQIPAYFDNFLQSNEKPRVFMRHAG
jgi:hypothetical protein